MEPVYPFDYTRFFRGNLDLIGSVTPPDETYMIRAADLVGQHEGELAFLITHRFGLDEAGEAYALYEMPDGDHALKVMIDGTDWQAITP